MKLSEDFYFVWKWVAKNPPANAGDAREGV